MRSHPSPRDSLCSMLGSPLVLDMRFPPLVSNCISVDSKTSVLPNPSRLQSAPSRPLLTDSIGLELQRSREPLAFKCRNLCNGV
jgi:hypothetical protein